MNTQNAQQRRRVEENQSGDDEDNFSLGISLNFRHPSVLFLPTDFSLCFFFFHSYHIHLVISGTISNADSFGHRLFKKKLVI